MMRRPVSAPALRAQLLLPSIGLHHRYPPASRLPSGAATSAPVAATTLEAEEQKEEKQHEEEEQEEEEHE